MINIYGRFLFSWLLALWAILSNNEIFTPYKILPSKLSYTSGDTSTLYNRAVITYLQPTLIYVKYLLFFTADLFIIFFHSFFNFFFLLGSLHFIFLCTSSLMFYFCVIFHLCFQCFSYFFALFYECLSFYLMLKKQNFRKKKIYRIHLQSNESIEFILKIKLCIISIILLHYNLRYP